MEKKVQLDTTIQIYRVFSHSSVKRVVLELLSRCQVFVSRYVLYEFKRTLIKAVMTFYTYIREEETVDDALDRAARTFSGREKTHFINIFRELIKNPGITEGKKKQLLVRLQRMFEWELLDIFEEGVSYIPDHVKCTPSKASPTEGMEQFVRQLRCQKDWDQCSLPRFLELKQKRLRRLIKLSKSSEYQKDKSFQNLASLCGKVLDDFSQCKGNNCKVLGDLIIALEVLPEHILLTSNISDFKPICEAIETSVRFIEYSDPKMPEL